MFWFWVLGVDKQQPIVKNVKNVKGLNLECGGEAVKGRDLGLKMWRQHSRQKCNGY